MSLWSFWFDIVATQPENTGSSCLYFVRKMDPTSCQQSCLERLRLNRSLLERLALNRAILENDYWALPVDDKGHENLFNKHVLRCGGR